MLELAFLALLFFAMGVALATNITWEFTFPPWFVALAASLLVLPSAGLAAFAVTTARTSATMATVAKVVAHMIWKSGFSAASATISAQPLRVTSTATSR